MTKGTIDKEKLKKLIDMKKLSMREISFRAGASESYLKDLVSGKIKSPTIDKFINLAEALGVYPGEIMPIDWQKPSTQDINIDLLGSAIQDVLERKADDTKAESITSFDKLCRLMAILYKKKLRDINRDDKATSQISLKVDKIK